MNHNVLKRGLNAESNDLIWIDMPTYGRLKNEITQRAPRFIEYIYFPLDAIFHEDLIKEGVFFGEDAYITQRYGSPMKRYYFQGYLKLLKRYCRENPFDYTDHVFACSKWSADLCNRIYGKMPRVLNPPISGNVRIVDSPVEFSARDNWIVMLGRYTDEKRYHWVISEVFPKIKNVVKDAKLVICGSVNTSNAENYLAQLENAAKKRNLTVSNGNMAADVCLLANTPRSVINDCMSKAKVFMHSTVNEHWGVAIAEAMATGIPVVVHKSGGAWTDVVMEGRFGLGYDYATEASDSVLRLLNDGGIWRNYSVGSMDRAKGMTLDNFTAKVSEIV